MLNCNEFPPLLLLLDRGRVGTVLGSALFVDILYVLIIFPRCRLKTKVDSVSCLNHSSYVNFLLSFTSFDCLSFATVSALICYNITNECCQAPHSEPRPSHTVQLES